MDSDDPDSDSGNVRQRLELIKELISSDRYNEARNAGFSLIDSMRRMYSSDFLENNKDEFTIVIDVIVTVIRCVSFSNDAEDNKKLLAMVYRIKPLRSIIHYGEVRNTIKTEDLLIAIAFIQKIANSLNKEDDRIVEVIQSVKLCCQVAWNHILFLCKKLSSKGDNDLEAAIVDLVTATCLANDSLLAMVSKCGKKEIITIVTSYLKSWSQAHDLYHQIPCPKSMVDRWKLLDQSNLQFGNYMLRIIILVLYTAVPDTTNILEKAKSYIECARQFRSFGVEFVADCKKSLSRAITMLSKSHLYNKTKDDSHPACHLLAKAYTLRALCSQDLEPNTEEFFDDVRNASVLWSNQMSSESEGHTCGVSETDLTLLFYLLDLLSIKGCMEHHCQLYETIIKCFKSTKVGEKDVLTRFWKSRNLSHALCDSPVCDAFITASSKNSELPDSMMSWKSCIGFEHKLFVLSTLSSEDSLHRDTATQKYISVVKDSASNLLDHPSRSSDFVAAHLYYDIAERLTKHGSMVEALLYANKALRLRTTLIDDCFPLSNNNMEKIKDVNMYPAVAIAAWSIDKEPSDPDGFFITPWNLMQCYLESTLQAGNLVEKANFARIHLLHGKRISYLLGLPTFSVSFSCALGNHYRKQQIWDLSQTHLESAKRIFADTQGRLSCFNCKTVLEVSINQHIGDLYLDRFKSNNKTGTELEDAERIYLDAEEMLKRHEWVNDFSNPQEYNECKPIFCDSIGIQSGVAARGCEAKCWHCQPSKVMYDLSLKTCMQMKWECTRRSLLLRLRIARGNCFAIRGDIQREHEVLLSSISVLIRRSTFHESKFSISPALVTELIKKNLIGDAFRVEHAFILYNTCCFSVKSIFSKNKSGIPTISKESIMSGLKLAFIISREIPTLHQKVSRLLAVMYMKDKELATSTSPSVNHLAAYFHQASIGNYINNSIITDVISRNNQNDDVFCLPISHRLLRSMPHSTGDLEASVLQFFSDLPKVTILCLSMLGADSDSWLSDLLPYSPTSAWIILSRLNPDGAPIIVILPVGSTFIDSEFSLQFTQNKASSVHPYVCRWGGDKIIDKVAPLFKAILEVSHNQQSINDNLLWAKQMSKLDQCLCQLLSDMQEKLFGRWKQLFCGEWSDYKRLDTRLQDHLKSKQNIDSDINILKIVLEGAGVETPKDEFLSELILSNGCYIHGLDGHNDSTIREQVPSSISKMVSKTLAKASTCRKPMILVLDLDIQMMPWENLPVLRCEDVYRMPSVMSICSTFQKSCFLKNHDMIFPSIEPKNGYYMLNPQGDLAYLQKQLSPLFQKLNFEGDVGTSRVTREISAVLKDRDLFVYVGHGTGSDCIRGCEVRTLERCPAVVLMGCESGSLHLKGEYNPDGDIFDYILAGSPFMGSNLWGISSGSGFRLTRSFLLSVIHSKDDTNLGSYMGQCRNSLPYLPYIEGAALVCYGIPTGIKKKN